MVRLIFVKNWYPDLLEMISSMCGSAGRYSLQREWYLPPISCMPKLKNSISIELCGDNDWSSLSRITRLPAAIMTPADTK